MLAVSAVCLLVALPAIVACSRKSTIEEKRYEVTGTVVSVNRQTRELTITHEDIPGYMKAMTMPFRVNDEWVFDRAAPGDHVRATLVVGERSHLENVSITKKTEGDSGSGGVRLPETGDPVPDLSLVNQDGKRLSLKDYRGKALLLTFIYTRCPLPDYCILMSNNFAAIAKELKKDAKLYERTRLLSISFDPAYDKPRVLREYGKTYAGEVDPKFTHWQFASGTPEEVKKAADFFGISYMKEKDQYVHSLRTVLIGPDGKIVRLFPGNEWKPGEAADAVAGIRF